MVLVFGVVAIACTADSGTLTMTDIPSRFNGMYAVFLGDGHNIGLIGAQTLVRISSGTVRIPVWTDEGARFNGSGAVYDVEIEIYDSPTNGRFIAEVEFESVVFSNGRATVSFHDNDGFWED